MLPKLVYPVSAKFSVNAPDADSAVVAHAVASCRCGGLLPLRVCVTVAGGGLRSGGYWSVGRVMPIPGTSVAPVSMSI